MSINIPLEFLLRYRKIILILIIIGVGAPTFYYVTGGIVNIQQIFESTIEEPKIEEEVVPEEEPMVEPVFEEEPKIEEEPSLFTQPHSPVVVIKGPREFERNKPVTFDGTQTFDPDGDENLSYFWILDDARIYTSTEPTITHIYENAGHHIIILHVIDESGLMGSMTTSINILP